MCEALLELNNKFIQKILITKAWNFFENCY